jgi:hypothetical protein
VVLSSNVWRQTGPLSISRDPGSLRADGTRVSYVTRAGTVFDVDRSQITAEWPWHGGGVNLTINDQTFQLSFVRPKGAAEFDKSDAENDAESDRGLTLALIGLTISSWADVFEAVSGTKNIWKGRGATRRWKAYFGGD